ncbi:unnamed protein product [Pipistrellus nathusii]|uniref:Uncharacterized protein n=1 Tax=Pipistrellus nathusii TaxID=59473 RepID=A0ABN9ZH67_PIPNA
MGLLPSSDSPGHPRLTLRCLGPAPALMPPQGWQREGSCMQWRLLGPPSLRTARYQYWLLSLLAAVPLVSHDCTFVGHKVIHTCITWSLDAEVPIHHTCLTAPPCCTART